MQKQLLQEAELGRPAKLAQALRPQGQMFPERFWPAKVTAKGTDLAQGGMGVGGWRASTELSRVPGKEGVLAQAFFPLPEGAGIVAQGKALGDVLETLSLHRPQERFLEGSRDGRGSLTVSCQSS